MSKTDIYRSFEQWKNGNVLEHGVPRTEYYSEAQLDLVEMGWKYGYDAGRAVEQALDKKAENARELGLDYEPAQQDIPDLIAGALGVSRGTAYDMMREALAEQPAQQEPVAWMQDSIELYVQDRPSATYTIPLYTSPQAQQAPDYAWPTIEDYEKEVGFKVNEAFRAAWAMARTTNDLFKQMGSGT